MTCRQRASALTTPRSSRIAALASMAVLSLAGLAQAGPPLRIDLRDAETGAFLHGTLQLQERRTDAMPAHRVALDRYAMADMTPGRWSIALAAEGYRPLSTEIEVDSKGPVALQLWLEPEHTRAFPLGNEHEAVIEGWVHLPAQGRAVAQAEVRLGSVATITDADGRFELRIAVPAALANEGVHETLHAHSPAGTSTRTLRVVPGAHRVIVDLGVVAHDVPDHRHDRAILQRPLDDGIDETALARAGVQPLAPVVPPPSTVRIGYADAGFTTPCCTGNCNAVAVLPLETYVRRGLNDEWIASWRADALRAGAIAYRSYGAWHVANPRTSTYDLCSSACCQVNDPDTSASTNAAVDATIGIVLERDGIFRSEYSAENNAWDDPDDGLSCSNADLSCGNGYVGSPSTGWPCLADSVATDRACFGHGRGMSQWGTQRWADLHARRWPWIVDHYYNAGGSGTGLRTAVIGSPLRIDTATVLPASASAGERVQLQFALTNLAGETHAAVYLGASLYRSGIGYISDPANDLGVSVPIGASLRERPFDLPSDLAAGNYDLLVALYLDVDGNGSINSGDFPLLSLTQPDALSVVAGVDALFADGFE